MYNENGKKQYPNEEISIDMNDADEDTQILHMKYDYIGGEPSVTFEWSDFANPGTQYCRQASKKQFGSRP